MLLFKIGFEGQPDKDVVVTAFAFNRKGEMIGSAPLKGGEAQLSLSSAQAATARVFFAPVLQGKRRQTPTINLMERLHAYEAHFIFDPKKSAYELLPIPQFHWQWWLWCACRVRGRVVKPVMVNGVQLDMPVCHARVHICEVDPFWLILKRLPDELIDRLRHELLVAIEKPFPWPPDPDPPGPIFRLDPAVMDFSPRNIARMNEGVTETPPVIASAGARGISNSQSDLTGRPGIRQASVSSGSDRAMLNPQPEPPSPLEPRTANLESAEKVILNPQQLAPATRAALMSGTLATVRSALMANIDLVRPFLCWWRWLWPYFYSCDEIAVLDTNAAGLFDTTIWYPCFGDHPDLYFWVEFSIGGVWTTVYRPPIRCHTYWNYVCGTEVTLHITDPRVPWCGDPPTMPGLQVAIMTIGNNVSLPEIQGSATGANEGLTMDGRPFGGSLEPHVWFGQDALIAAHITHYKWSYRKMDAMDTWHAMDHQVVRHYAVIDPAPPHALKFLPELMGPDPAFPAKNLIRIQPTAAPAGSYGWAPMVDARENSASSFFLSHLLEGGDAAAAGGKYELKLELFDDTGDLVNLTDKGVLLKVPTINAPFGAVEVPTAAPANEYLIKDGTGDVIGFKMVLRVDNNPCEAQIYQTTVGAAIAGDCGFINYPAGADAHISFKARHPNNFATFNFGLYRGSWGEILDVSGSVAASPINGFTRNAAGVYSDDRHVADLVGTCPGGAAAFAETLHVDALATDGWNILDYLDRDAVPMAFALKPL
ncbi:MAG TPA: hypothetical protein P5186_16405 [Candidatus Paceibacterota bacterium]|nr:hypothetical protein [Verrucomicrobiota bacterium]HRY49631.1 hypothetical protein [Candidatus Paceibacterota bacterium]